MQIGEYMQMIFNTIYSIQMTVFVFYYTSNIGIKLISIILFNGWQAVLCPENKVIQKLTIT